MFYAMFSKEFRRAFLTGKFGNKRDSRQAAMLATRHLVDEVHGSERMVAISVAPHQGIKAQLFVYKKSEPHLMELIKNTEKEVMLDMKLLYHRDQAMQFQIEELKAEIEELEDSREGV